MNLSTKQTQTHRHTAVAKVGVGSGGLESGIGRCQLLHMEWMDSKILLSSTANCLQFLRYRNGKNIYI